MKKILVVTAHPDDESFGMGATITKYAAEGVEIHLLCATRGEAGQWSEVLATGRELGKVREEEHRKAANILGISKLEYMDYVDGTINNLILEEMERKILSKIRKLEPQVIVTFDLSGISGHLDHIGVTQATTRAFLKFPGASKLYFLCLPKEMADEGTKKYVWKIWGREESEITTKIDVERFFDQRMQASCEHKTQMNDVNNLKELWKKYSHFDHFELVESRVKTRFPESDLFAGIDTGG